MKIKRLCVDRLSSLPPNIIETILCLIPIREAVRTCILSKEWRYNWTKIPKLMFDESTFQVSSSEINNFCNVIYQILLLHQGPIVELSLSICEEDTCVELDQIILYLSRMNTVKKLRLGYMCRIPLDVFSLQQLTDLYLYNGCIDRQQTFSGFSSITTLTIDDIEISKKTLAHLLSKCPLLKTFNLLHGDMHMQSDGDYTDIIELFEYLPVIENVTINLWHLLCIDEHSRELPTSLYNLKYMCLYDLLLGDGESFYGMPLLADLIRASPNLEKLKLRTFTCTKLDEEAEDVGDDYYYYYPEDIELNNLKELEIEDLCNLKIELDFVKLMLVKSPVLKTLRIFLFRSVTKDEELEILNVLLSCPRASPLVEINLHRHV